MHDLLYADGNQKKSQVHKNNTCTDRCIKLIGDDHSHSEADKGKDSGTDGYSEEVVEDLSCNEARE